LRSQPGRPRGIRALATIPGRHGYRLNRSELARTVKCLSLLGNDFGSGPWAGWQPPSRGSEARKPAMMKYYALYSTFIFFVLFAPFSFLIGTWAGMPAGVLTTAIMWGLSRSRIASHRTAGSAAVVMGVATVGGTVIAFIRVADREALGGVWWPAIVEIVVGVVVVLVGAGWLVRKLRSPKVSPQTQKAGTERRVQG
jgi:hypothetical protein